MEKIEKCLKHEGGQVLVLAALLMTVLIGIAALAVDIGMVAVTKSKLQNDADAAALAGAMEISSGKTKAEEAAKLYAKANDSKLEDSNIKAKADTGARTIEVVCTKKVSYTFAKVLGFSNTEVSAIAVAELPAVQWTGDALPFINITFDYLNTDPMAWTNAGKGLKGTVTDFYTRNSGTDNAYFELEYADGLTIKEGFSNGEKGLDGSKLSDGLDYVLTDEDKNIKKVYIFSLSSKVIQSGEVTVNNRKKTIPLNKLNQLKNNDVIDPYQLVLIECLLIDYKDSNKHDIELKYLGKTYDLGNNDPSNPLPDYPTDYVRPGGGSTRLIK
ncbi:Tad domain-containing protein [Sedimentibacter saalensis]|uniref:Flp pilus assembly protein TadG n=1 Tax=Sedimentibacter saalensis TaxID=130788 RepID=A0A562J7J0_9FIRM|nr:Tad domain-containing protein [Sedimentibacter saalensis]TWH79080.1 Flp pilus assembly protein TadG [Sedimentibacter saalensis]